MTGPSAYTIVDEGQRSRFSSLAIEPLIILFLSMLVPAAYKPLVLVWLLANAWFLGDASRWKQLRLVALVVVGVVLSILGLGSYMANMLDAQTATAIAGDVQPYVRLAIYGLFFWLLYRLTTYQAMPYALHEFLNQNRAGS